MSSSTPRASSWAALRGWAPRRWGAAALAALGFAMVVAVPTGIDSTAIRGSSSRPTMSRSMAKPIWTSGWVWASREGAKAATRA